MPSPVLLFESSEVTSPAASPSSPVTLDSGQVSAAGDNTLVTPSAGHSLRLYYLSWNPTNATVEAFFKLSGGRTFLRNKLIANCVVAKELGLTRFGQLNLGDPLILTLDVAAPVDWNAVYREV